MHETLNSVICFGTITFIWPTAGISASSILQRDICGELCMITFSCSCISISWSIVLIHIYLSLLILECMYVIIDIWSEIGLDLCHAWIGACLLYNVAASERMALVKHYVYGDMHDWDLYTLAKKSQNSDVSAAFISDRRPKAADWNVWTFVTFWLVCTNLNHVWIT